MFIKITQGGETQFYHATSYYRNQLTNQAFDLNIETKGNGTVRLHFDDCTKVECYVINEDGETIDRI